jgi:hypothetical protein
VCHCQFCVTVYTVQLFVMLPGRHSGGVHTGGGMIATIATDGRLRLLPITYPEHWSGPTTACSGSCLWLPTSSKYPWSLVLQLLMYYPNTILHVEVVGWPLDDVLRNDFVLD